MWCWTVFLILFFPCIYSSLKEVWIFLYGHRCQIVLYFLHSLVMLNLKITLWLHTIPSYFENKYWRKKNLLCSSCCTIMYGEYGRSGSLCLLTSASNGSEQQAHAYFVLWSLLCQFCTLFFFSFWNTWPKHALLNREQLLLMSVWHIKNGFAVGTGSIGG